MLLAVAGFVLLVVRPFFIPPYPLGILTLGLVPICALAATVSGIVGFRQARAVHGPKTTAILGFLGGLVVLVVSLAYLLFLWALSRSNVQF